MPSFTKAVPTGTNKPEFEKGTKETKIERNVAMPSPDMRDSYHTSSINSKEQPLEHLAPYIDGYEPWPVNYYRQALGEDDPVLAYDSTLHVAHQSYAKVTDLELKVIEPIRYEYLKQGQRENFTGTSIIVPGTIVPNRFDLLVASIDGKIDIVFTVTDVTPLTSMAETAYEISYTSISADLKDIELKVISEVTYSRNNLLQGGKPLLNPIEVSLVNRLEEVAGDLFQMYQDDFAKGEYLSVPHEKEDIVDLFLMNFFYETNAVSDYMPLRKLQWFDRSYIAGCEELTLWDALLRHDSVSDKGMRHRMCSEMYIVSCSDHNLRHKHASLGGVYYTNIDYVVLPKSEGMRSNTFTEMLDSKLRTTEVSEIVPVNNVLDLQDEVSNTGENVRAVSDVFPVCKDNYYVFSAKFYEGDRERMSGLELMTYNYLKGEPVNTAALLPIANKAFNFGDLERFYYVPIIIKLIEARLKDV